MAFPAKIRLGHKGMQDTTNTLAYNRIFVKYGQKNYNIGPRVEGSQSLWSTFAVVIWATRCPCYKNVTVVNYEFFKQVTSVCPWQAIGAWSNVFG